MQQDPNPAAKPLWATHPPGLREMALLLESAWGDRLRLPRETFDIAGAPIEHAGKSARASENVVLDLPFARLLRFGMSTGPRPAVLVVAPMSGHSSAQLRDTVLGLLPRYDVLVTDWRDARDVPLAEGGFGLDEYIDYLLRFMAEVGPDTHMLAICQSCVPALAAVALLAEDADPAQPRSLTLMAGPIDARQSPSPVNHFATGAPLDWFEQQLISTVAPDKPGAGRRVYGGAMQIITSAGMENRRRIASLSASLLDPFRCWQAMLQLGSGMPAQQPVLDLAAEFYLDNLRDVFQQCALARDKLRHRGRPVRPQAIRNLRLLTVEAGADEICGAGQTRAAHGLCSGVAASRKFHFDAAGAEHRDVFSGRHWRDQVLPQVLKLMGSADA
ncbi:MAG: polyhydroxyalkanoate depolymerase [Noviherbaspirillum sp.]